MSLENAKKLVAKLSGNESLKEEFRKAGAGSFEQVAKKHGLDATPEEFKQSLTEHLSSHSLLSHTADKIAASIGSINVV